MANMSDYLETALLNQLFRNTPMAAPANVYASLHTAAPTEDGVTPNEVTGGSYARVALSTGTAGTGAGSGWTAPVTDTVDATLKKVDNVAAIVFPTPTAAWGTVTHLGLYDALTGGNLLMANNVTASKPITTGDPVRYEIGDLDFKMG